MQETAQEYTQRLLGYLDGKPGLRVQQTTPKKLALLTKQLDHKNLAKRPAPDKWSVSEILAHLADSELVIAWRFAGSPTLRSPLSRNATIEGVVLLPSLLGITTGSLPSITATQLLVVPRSIPIIFPIFLLCSLSKIF
jgi:hypothetical protein